MSDIKYFVNCRGATLNQVHTTEWDESGLMPRLAAPFLPYTSSLNTDIMTFCGSTKSSNWLYFDADLVRSQITKLRSIGVNLIRVYGDMYCWALMGSDYLSSVAAIADICEEKKIYTQWVLFDGYTEGDTSSTSHALGYFDPSTVYEGLAWGIKRWQRCPNVANNGLPTRNPSSMVASGNSYVTDMVTTVSSYRSTLSWEVMHDVNIQSTESQGYNFVTSAISKVRSLIPASQKITFSTRDLNCLSAIVTGTVRPDIFSSGIVSSLTPLVDYVCSINSRSNLISQIENYIGLVDFSRKTGKPVMILDSFTDNANTEKELIDFSRDFKIGIILEGIADRTFSNKPFNSNKGLLYDDGEVRDSENVGLFVEKTKLDGFLKARDLVKLVTEKITFDTLTTQIEIDAPEPPDPEDPPIIPPVETFDRFNQFGKYGITAWNTIYNASRVMPEYSGIPIGFADLDYQRRSGYGLVGDGSLYSKDGVFITLLNLITELTAYGLNTISNNLTRDKLAYNRITKLITLTNDLNMYKGHNYYGASSYGYGFLASATQEAVYSACIDFMPRSLTKNSDYIITPYIGTPRYLSSVTLLDGPYRESMSNCQKPICFWLRPSGYASGSCLYSSPINLATDDGASNILAKLNWTLYDSKLLTWANAVYAAYIELNNALKTYLDSTFGDSRLEGYLSTAVDSRASED